MDFKPDCFYAIPHKGLLLSILALIRIRSKLIALAPLFERVPVRYPDQ
jgi:hypothetical protein